MQVEAFELFLIIPLILFILSKSSAPCRTEERMF